MISTVTYLLLITLVLLLVASTMTTHVSSASSVEQRQTIPLISTTPLPSSPPNLGALICKVSPFDSNAAFCTPVMVAVVLKLSLSPFAVLQQSTLEAGRYMTNCDFLVKSSAASSPLICAKGKNDQGLYFYNTSLSLARFHFLPINPMRNWPHIAIDSLQEIGYVSSQNDNSPYIFKVINLGSSSPTVSNALYSLNPGARNANSLLLLGNFLYVSLMMDPDPLQFARVRISDFMWNQTVTLTRIGGAFTDGFVNDDKYIYYLSQGVIERLSYGDGASDFYRVDNFDTGLNVRTDSLYYSPTLKVLTGASTSGQIFVVNVSAFGSSSNNFFCSSPPSSVPEAWGSPLTYSITSTMNENTGTMEFTSKILGFAFGHANAYIFDFNSTTCNENGGLPSPTSVSPPSSPAAFSPSPSSTSPSSNQHENSAIIAAAVGGIAGGLLLAFMLGLVCFLYYRNHHRRAAASEESTSERESMSPKKEKTTKKKTGRYTRGEEEDEEGTSTRRFAPIDESIVLQIPPHAATLENQNEMFVMGPGVPFGQLQRQDQNISQ